MVIQRKQSLSAVLAVSVSVVAGSFLVASCSGANQVQIRPRQKVENAIAAPKHSAIKRLPPSSDWMMLSGPKEKAMPKIGLALFAWHWSFSCVGDNCTSRPSDFRRIEQKPQLPFQPKGFHAGKLRSALDLGVPGSGWGTLWLLGFEEVVDKEFIPGSLWWTDSGGGVVRPVAGGGDVVALYRTRAGAVALQNRSCSKCKGVKDGRPDCETVVESSVLLVRVLSFLQSPDIEHVIRIPGPVRRHFIQEDDSIVIEGGDSFWLLMPSGKEIRRICERGKLAGAPRNITLMDGGEARVLTNEGLWKVGEDGKHVEKIAVVDTTYTYPMPRYVPVHFASDGDVFLGLTFFMVRLAKEGGAFREEWYVPADCPIARVSESGMCGCIRVQGEMTVRDCSKIGAIEGW